MPPPPAPPPPLLPQPGGLRDLEDMQPTLGRSLRQLLQFEVRLAWGCGRRQWWTLAIDPNSDPFPHLPSTCAPPPFP
jgi:hypothetical protein